MKRLEDVGLALVAHREPAEPGEPPQRPLDGPAVPDEPLGAVDHAPGDPGDDAALATGAAAAGVVVASVGVQLARALARPAHCRTGGPGHRQRARPRLTAVVHTASHLIVAAALGVGPGQDPPDLAPAVRWAAELVVSDTVLVDAGHDAGHDHHPCREELGIRRAVVAPEPCDAGDRWPAAPHRRALRLEFPD